VEDVIEGSMVKHRLQCRRSAPDSQADTSVSSRTLERVDAHRARKDIEGNTFKAARPLINPFDVAA
ncbi:MAG TPA: hypothetical protein VE549_00290, partial [Myxococcaceae bacterium]|nr:hypothetical protein [Myxococcaceae bacterium]